MKNQYWQHNNSGERYAVRLNENNEVVEATNALYYQDITETNLQEWNFDGEPEMVDWLNQTRDEYHVTDYRYEK